MGTSCIAKFSTFSLFFSFWFSFRKVLDHLFTTPSIIILVFVMSRVMTFPISVVRPMFVVMMMVTVVLLPFPAHVAGHHHRLGVLPVHLAAQARPEVGLCMINQSGRHGPVLPTGDSNWWVIMNVSARFLCGKVTNQRKLLIINSFSLENDSGVSLFLF